jgi:hypothetical protein
MSNSKRALIQIPTNEELYIYGEDCFVEIRLTPNQVLALQRMADELFGVAREIIKIALLCPALFGALARSLCDKGTNGGTIIDAEKRLEADCHFTRN